jgi:hypothetical protein
VHRAARGVLVTTDCLYPDGTAVVVVVSGGERGETLIVHDDGGATDALVSAGRASVRASGIMRMIAQRFDLRVSEGAITSAPSPIADVAALIPLVANASQEAARRLLEASVPLRRRDVPGEAVRALQAWRPDIEIHREHAVLGASSRTHRFDLFAPLPGGAALLIDAVTPDAASVNAAVVANFDVGRRRDARFARAIVFDPDMIEKFGPGNLALLGEAALTIPIEVLASKLPELAMAA